MKEINKLRPFGKFCATIGNLPSSYLESMSFEEQLLWFCDFLKNKVVPSVNNNAEALEELQNYVANYFSNLDVQEEINNKLDEMAESGELEEIIAQFLNLNTVLAFNNLEALKNATNLINGSFAKTYGFYSLNDGGGAFYKIRNITNEDNPNNIDLIALTSDNTLVAELIFDNEINVLQIGCKNDNSQDISNIVNYMTQKANLFFPCGIYKVSNPLQLINNIRGIYVNRDENQDINNNLSSLLLSDIQNNSTGDNVSTKCVINISNTNYGFCLKDINIKCNSNENGVFGFFDKYNRVYLENIGIYNIHNGNGIYINADEFRSRQIFINNIIIFGTSEDYCNSTGIKILNTGDNKLENLEIMGCQKGVILDQICMGNNWIIWCGPLQGYDNNNWWGNTVAIEIVEGLYNNLYLDTAHLFIVSNNNRHIKINNLTTMNDSSMQGSNKYDSSIFYDFQGIVNNFNCYIDERLLYLLPSFGKVNNVTPISRYNVNNIYNGKQNICGSRFYDVSYQLQKINPNNKLLEIAKIYPSNTTDSIILNVFHAQSQYAKFKLNFENGYFVDSDVIESKGTDNYYISKNKNNDFYTVYIDMHSSYDEWVDIDVKKGNQTSNLNLLDLNLQMINGTDYTFEKVDYNQNLFDTIL